MHTMHGILSRQVVLMGMVRSGVFALNCGQLEPESVTAGDEETECSEHYWIHKISLVILPEEQNSNDKEDDGQDDSWRNLVRHGFY